MSPSQPPACPGCNDDHAAHAAPLMLRDRAAGRIDWRKINDVLERVTQSVDPFAVNGISQRQYYRQRLACALAEYDDGRAVLAKMRPARQQQWQAEMLGLLHEAAAAYLEHDHG